VFIGGSSGNMDEIFNFILNKNPNVNIVINTITLQSLNEALGAMEKYKIDNVEVVNVTVSKSKKVGPYDMMMGQNPIYIVSGKGSGLY
jgi:precorrin-6B methylase 2